MGFVPKWSRDNQKKTSQRTYSQGEVKQLPSLFHGAKDAQFSAPNLFADGGEVSEEVLKSEGLKASEGENVGFFDRLKAGNIDEPGSEAYNRFGAGRGRREREAAAAFKQMDDIESGRKDEMKRLSDEAAAESRKVVTTPIPEPAKIEAKPVSQPRAAAPKPASKPVNYSSADDESAAETARLAEAGRRAREKAEVPQAGMVSPRPKMNWSTPADRARWDEKYKATHNEDGTRK